MCIRDRKSSNGMKGVSESCQREKLNTTRKYTYARTCVSNYDRSFIGDLVRLYTAASTTSNSGRVPTYMYVLYRQIQARMLEGPS